jgi:hypothetical protein
MQEALAALGHGWPVLLIYIGFGAILAGLCGQFLKSSWVSQRIYCPFILLMGIGLPVFGRVWGLDM